MKYKLVMALMVCMLIIFRGYAQKELSGPAGTEKVTNENQKANIKVAAQYFECLFKTGNFVLMGKIVSPQAVYNQTEGLPYGGVYVGLNEWIKMYTKAQRLFNLQIEGEPEYFTSTIPNQVIIYFRIKCQSKSSDKEISMSIAEYFEIRDNLIMNIRPFYFDTKKFTEFLN